MRVGAGRPLAAGPERTTSVGATGRRRPTIGHSGRPDVNVRAHPAKPFGLFSPRRGLCRFSPTVYRRAKRLPIDPSSSPQPPSPPRNGEEKGEKEWGFEAGGFAARLKPPGFPLPRAAQRQRGTNDSETLMNLGPGGGVSPEGQVASIPVYVRVNFLKFISRRNRSAKADHWPQAQKGRLQAAQPVGTGRPSAADQSPGRKRPGSSYEALRAIFSPRRGLC
jgi:hypothetical protein